MMNEKEICRAYNRAGNLREKIRELAARNDTTVEVIREILRRNGYAPPVMVPGPIPASFWPGADAAMIKTSRLVSLVEQGASASEIAEEFGISYGQALTWVARLCVLCEEYITQAEEVPHAAQ